jgi:hypothetical protein
MVRLLSSRCRVIEGYSRHARARHFHYSTIDMPRGQIK